MFKAIERHNGILGEIPLDKKIRIILSDNFAEIMALEKETNPFNNKRISSRQYIDKNTGEVFNYKLKDTNGKSDESIRKALKRFSYIAKSNFEGKRYGIFLTLGYENKMDDMAQLNHDYNLFWRKLKRRYPLLDYIGVVEYKNNKSLHMHILLKSSDEKRLFLDREELIKLWGQNDVYIRRIDPHEGISKLTNYVNPFVNKKKYERLKFYERNSRIYRKSKGIIAPKKLTMTLEQAIELLNNNGYKEYNRSAYDIIGKLNDDMEVKLNNVTKIEYRKETV